MKQMIEKMTIEGFKSIRKQEIELRPINILIGANGSGKSNFVSFFSMLSEMMKGHFQIFIAKQGGAEAHLFLGSKVTKRIAGRIQFGDRAYSFGLELTSADRFIFAEEAVGGKTVSEGMGLQWQEELAKLGDGESESQLYKLREEPGYLGSNLEVFRDAISGWVVYHFHDTGDTSPIKRWNAINDNEYFRGDASNLAAFLYRLSKENDETRICYKKIRDVVWLVAPFFEDFKLRPIPENPNQIQLEWKQKDSDYPFLGFQLSDGTLRFICLATALLQPNPPSTIVIDEPELGLHPYALTLLASLIKQASHRAQVIISTQSAALLDHFEPEDVIVVEREDGESAFRRVDRANLTEWLEDYTLGELWWKNVLGGRPHR